MMVETGRIGLEINATIKIMVEMAKFVIGSGLLIHELLHGLIALPFVILLYKKTKSKKLVLVLFLITYFMDLDHLIDYFFHFGASFNLGQFLLGASFRESGKAFIFFHGWEYFAVFFYLGYRKKWKSEYMAIALGMLPHLIWDSIHVGNVFVYFILHRAINSFYIL